MKQFKKQPAPKPKSKVENAKRILDKTGTSPKRAAKAIKEVAKKKVTFL